MTYELYEILILGIQLYLYVVMVLCATIARLYNIIWLTKPETSIILLITENDY